MLQIRFKDTFRERMPEWTLALGLFMWGIVTLSLSNELFQTQQFFSPLLKIMSQDAWGVSAIAIGFIRVIFLAINGAWRPSAHIRAIGCAAGAIFWGALLIEATTLSWTSPTMSLYATFLITDLISLWFAAGDAKLADLSAKGKIIRV